MVLTVWGFFLAMRTIVPHINSIDKAYVLLLEQVNSGTYVSEPKILIKDGLKDFFNTKISDINLLDYECSEENFKYDIAV